MFFRFIFISFLACFLIYLWIYESMHVFLKNIWRNHHLMWKQGSQSAILSKSTRLERSSLWMDSVWISMRIRSHLFLATMELEKQPQCELYYLFPPCFATWLSVHVIFQCATNLTCTQWLYCRYINSVVTAFNNWHLLRGRLSHRVSCCVNSWSYLIAV